MTKFWKFAPWLTRFMLLFPTFIFSAIALKYLMHPAQEAAHFGIILNTPLAATILRVGFAGFPLGCAVFTFSCLVSQRRILTGLSFVSTMLGVVLVVRIYGVLVDGTLQGNLALIRAEIIMLMIMGIGIFIELGRRRRLDNQNAEPRRTNAQTALAS